MKKGISMYYHSCKSNWKPLVRLDIILELSNIYIHSNLNPLTNFTSSSRSTKFKYILSWIVISYVMKLGIPLWISCKVNGNWDNKMIRISKWRERQCRINSNVKGRKKSIVWDASRKVNHWSKVIFETEKL